MISKRVKTPFDINPESNTFTATLITQNQTCFEI